MIQRQLEKVIKGAYRKGKVIILIGARQVGKTTLLRQILKETGEAFLWMNADESDVLGDLSQATTSSQLIALFEGYSIVVIDEAQQIPDIGKKLKLVHDTKPEIQIIATGSSAFELQNETAEPLTGRKKTFFLYPVSYMEWADYAGIREARRLLESRIVFGNYPEVVNNPGKEKEILIEIAQSYLYKDILKLDHIRKPGHIEKLVKALAFQVGSEVNYHELAKTVGNINTATVEKYLDLLEKTYVIFKLPAFHRNQRNEIRKGKKYYFYDTGIRNVLISNFMSLEMRYDKGALWENFLISERLKANHYLSQHANTYFWRTQDRAGIDYIEERDGRLFAYEIKWKPGKIKFPASFIASYPENKLQVVNRENFEDFVRIKL